MKRILLVFVTFLLFLGISFSTIDVNADFSDFIKVTIWWSSDDIPYCNWNDCWLWKWVNAVKDAQLIQWWDTTASGYAVSVVRYILTFLFLISVIVIIYAGFVLLLWLWDEEKSKKAKQIIIYAIIWIVVIFLAWPLTTFIINVLNQ